jgi:hypothetical protein
VADPEYGVGIALDNTDALATDPASHYVWDGVYRFPLGQSILELPDDGQLASALLGIYLASGLDGVAVAWETARATLDTFGKPSPAEAALTQTQPESGTTTDYDTSLARFQRELVDANPSVASRRTLAEARAHNADFKRRLVRALDDIVSAEEEAQRWYERKLIDLIDAHLTHQKTVIERAWTTTYQVGRKGKKDPEGAVSIGADESSATLSIRSTADMVDVERFSAVVNGRFQDAAVAKASVPGVIAALHHVGSLYFQYKRDLEARIKANKIRRREGAAALAIKDLPSYDAFRKALHERGTKYFIIWATFQHVVEDKAIETAFTQAMQDRCERLIIDGLRAAWENCDVVIANAKTDRLFKDEKPKCVIGGDGMGTPASASVVAAAYRPVPKVGLLGVSAKKPEVSRSPWVQAPFHALMLSVATNELAAATVAVTPVDHLRALFQSDEDRKRLLSLKSLGSFVARAREEMVSALQERDRLDESGRRNISLAIAGLGLVSAPFTGGASLLVAGMVDATLVADKTSHQIAQWIAAEQYSALVVDEMTAEAWHEPAVTELMSLVFEAGFQIAGDLVQEGALAHFFAAVGLTELLVAGGSYALSTLKPSGTAP